MRSILLTLLVVVGLVSSVGAESPKQAEPPAPPAPSALSGDYARLQGTWVVTRNEIKTVPLPQMNGALFIFEKRGFRLGTDSGSEAFTIDETVSPKRIDFEDGYSPAILGIYTLDGDRLVICSSGPGDPRPTEFKTSPASSAVLTELKRK